MRDKRPVGDLSVEELERILAVKRREQRMARFRHQQDNGRQLAVPPPDAPVAPTSDEMAPSSLPVATTTSVPIEQDDPQDELAPVVFEDLDAVYFVDEPHTKSLEANQLLDPGSSWRRYFNLGLLGIEVLAVVGLVAVLYLGFVGLDDIQENTNQTQRELAAAREINRYTPTPLPELTPSELVIPGGHTPPDQDGFTSFNYMELDRAFDYHAIPQNVRPALIQQINSTRTRQEDPQPNDPVFIDIPAIGINRGSILPGADWDTLRGGIGWFKNGAAPGRNQNVVLVGHNDIYGEIFRELPAMEKGDEIRIYASNGQQYTYRVTDTEVVEPTDVWVLDSNSGAHLTLITCYPYQVDSQRFIVFAELVS